MGWFSDLVGSAVKMAGRVARSVAKAVTTAVVTVAAYAKKVVDKVQQGWEGVKQRFFGDQERDAQEKAQVDREVAAAQEEEKASTEALRTEKVRRQSEAEAAARAAKEAELEHKIRLSEQKRGHAQFLQRCAEARLNLHEKLSDEAPTDFEGYARLRLVRDLSTQLRKRGGTLEGWLAFGDVEQRADRAIEALIHTREGEEMPEEAIEGLDEFCRHEFGKSLMVMAVERWFEPHSREFFDCKEKAKGFPRRKAENERARARARPDPENPETISREADLQRKRLEAQAESLAAEKRALDDRIVDLRIVTGVSEGFIQIYSGNEQDEAMHQEAVQAGEYLRRWQDSGVMSPAARDFLATFAGVYEYRAKERVESLGKETVSVTA
jgi:hypothetical protein